MIPKGKNIYNEQKSSMNKDKFSKEIENNNLLVNNDKYTKNFVDIDINLANNRHIGSVKTKYKTPSKAAKPIIPPFNNANQKTKNEDFQKKVNKNNIPKGNNINIPSNINSNLNISKNNKQKNLQKKQNTSNFLLNNNNKYNDNNKESKFEEPFNSNISMISSSTNKNNNAPKDRIKVMINKLENLYKDALNNSNKIKTETLPFNINYNQGDMINVLLEEIKYLKIKNEIIKLKSNFHEIIFYTIKELIEDTKRDVSFNQEISEYINNFHNKLLCILTQNNQKFYENLKILDNGNNNDVLFAFNLKEDDIMDKLNQKNLTVLSNIEDNIQNIIKNIDDIIMGNNYNNGNDSDFMLKMNSLKLHLLMASNNIVSYYLLSDNFNYQFKNKNKFIVFSPENIANNQINQRKNKIKNDWEKLVKPLIHKVLTPKNEKELINFIINLSMFYENMNKNIYVENNALKINFDINNGKLNLLIQKLKNVIDNYINSNDDGFTKLNELFNFLDENQSKNADKVVFSLINTEKQNYLNLIYNFNLLKQAISQTIIA